jgi:ribonucleoside-diphosphate reductase alpha chain
MLEGRQFVEVNPALERELRQLGAAGKEPLTVVRRSGSLSGASGVPEDLKRRFPIALEIAPHLHLRMQAAIQEQIDAAVSKTVNLPRDASPQSVREIFMLAHELRLKGVTVYRYGSRPGQTLSLVEDTSTPDCRECSV